MKYFSTRDPSKQATTDLKTALLCGLAPDGGLFLPERIPQVSAEQVSAWRQGMAFAALAGELAVAWFGDEIAPERVRAMARETYDFAPVLKELEPQRYVCELFHGPSLSFKDFAAQFLGRLLNHLLERDNESALVLTATSGDTGSAVAAACHGLSRLTCVILYPHGRISPIQEQQIATWGGNVHAVAVQGTFDDCQRLVKAALQRRAGKDAARHVTSANSINIGRLLPQTFYYWYAATQLAGVDTPLTMVVPSGNFGNLTAGILARQMGAPIDHFIAATNANDAVPRFLETGVFEPHETAQTISNAMDVGNPSNFERLAYLFDKDVAQMRAVITGLAITDDTTRATMRRVFSAAHYLLDPHSAVAWSALTQCGAAQADQILVALATADPAKFPEVMHSATRQTPAVPARLQQMLDRPMLSTRLDAVSDEAVDQFLATI